MIPKCGPKLRRIRLGPDDTRILLYTRALQLIATTCPNIEQFYQENKVVSIFDLWNYINACPGGTKLRIVTPETPILEAVCAPCHYNFDNLRYLLRKCPEVQTLVIGRDDLREVSSHWSTSNVIQEIRFYPERSSDVQEMESIVAVCPQLNRCH